MDTPLRCSMKSGRAIFKVLTNQRGNSLLELIMVIIFLGVAFVTTLGMMSTGITKSVKIEQLTRALMLAEQKMEEVRGDKSTRGYSWITENNYPVENNPGGYSGFKRTVNVISYSTYKQVQVVVEHDELPKVELYTHIANF